MIAKRLAGIPIDHVVAELAAFPVASVAALELGLTQLRPATGDDRGAGESVRRLWREAERYLTTSFPAFSVDEAVAIRDFLWFSEESVPTVPLHGYLRRLAREYLSPRGRAAVPCLGSNVPHTLPANDVQESLGRERWRWLALALPPDLLLGALDGHGQGPERVEMLSSALERHLCDSGFAETHLHLGAGLDFPLLWIALLHSIAEPGLDSAAFRSPGAVLEEGRLIGAWVLRAAIVRYLLAGFLSGRQLGEDFFGYLGRVSVDRLVRHLGRVNYALLWECLCEMRTGRLSSYSRTGRTHANLQWIYAQLAGLPPPGPHRMRNYAAAEASDPIAPLLSGPARDRRSAEIQFVARALAYLERTAGDLLFTRLFWQVVRVRSLFYRHVVQRPMIPGLQWFIRFYGRLSPSRRPLSTRVQLESAARTGGRDGGLRSLEVRTSPEADRSRLLHFVRDVEWAARTLGEDRGCAPPCRCSRAGREPGHWCPGMEMGVVFHFTKDRGGETRGGNPIPHGRSSNADPRCRANLSRGRNPSGYRYAQYFNEKQSEASSLKWLLEEYPLCLELVRGLDVCTDELGIPNWVLAPVLDEVRRAGEEASARVRQRYGLSIPGLAVTVHAGEDFVHLLTGLRQVDEAIQGFCMRSGDRIGHGIALGVDPRDWARRSGKVLLTREERMWDLVWEWSWYSRGGTCADPGRPSYIERELARLSAAMFDETVTPYELELLRIDLYDPPKVRRTGFPNDLPRPIQPVNGRRKPFDRLVAYLTSENIFHKGMELIWIDTSGEGEVLATLQADLRRKVGARGLTVEVNPTSNLLIGNMGDLTGHPLWRLRPPRPLPDSPPVSICVGSDDPVVFGSDLKREYQALFDALLLAGLSEEETRQWLDRTRAAGLEARFTLAERSGRSIFDRLPPRPGR